MHPRPPFAPRPRPALSALLLLAACQGPAPLPAAMATAPAPMRAGFLFDQAPYPYCHTATVAETAPGDVVAAWAGGGAEKQSDVGIWMARLENGVWGPMSKIADGAQPGGRTLPSWNPVLFQLRRGPLVLFYKVGPDTSAWRGMMKTSPDGGRTWGAPQRLPDGVIGPAKNKPLELADGTWLCGSSREDGPSGWRIRFERSSDGGRTWLVTEPPSPGFTGLRPFGAIQPTLLRHADGRLQALCRTRNGVLVATWSQDNGAHWTTPADTGLPNPNSGVDGVTLADGRQLLAYNHAGRSFAGFGWGPRWPLDVAISDDGIRWRHVMTLESGPADNGYAYPSVIQTGDGLVHIVYTWKRVRIKHVVLDPTRF